MSEQAKKRPRSVFVHGGGSDPLGRARCAWVKSPRNPHVREGQGWTNYDAVYVAVLCALESLPADSIAVIYCSVDIIVKQMRGRSAIHQPRLQACADQIRQLINAKRLRLTWLWLPVNSNPAAEALKAEAEKRSKCLNRSFRR